MMSPDLPGVVLVHILVRVAGSITVVGTQVFVADRSVHAGAAQVLGVGVRRFAVAFVAANAAAVADGNQ